MLACGPTTTTPSSPFAELLAERRDEGEPTRPSPCSTASPNAGTRRVGALVRIGDAPGADGDGAAGGDDITATLDGLLDRVKADDDARQQYVDLLEVLGPDDPRTADYRKRLTRQLF